MNTLDPRSREILLTAMIDLPVNAEAMTDEERRRYTLPVPRHAKVLEPNFMLITGDRGAGKTHLFRVLQDPEWRLTIGPSRQVENALWVCGFMTSIEFPSETELERAANGGATDLHLFWKCLLLARLSQLAETPKEWLTDHLGDDWALNLNDLRDIPKWFGYLQSHAAQIDKALDALDQKLQADQRYCFVTYDDLDIMALAWPTKRSLIRALLQLWLIQHRRWARLRSKIFLRNDLLSNQVQDFPDASKLNAYRFDLTWSVRELYLVVVHSWLNHSDACREQLLRHFNLLAAETPFGFCLSGVMEEADLRDLITRMTGVYMGKSPKKGRVYDWIPNHLKDARGHIVPRSFLRLFKLAAHLELEQGLNRSHLLDSTALAQSERTVSELRIAELAEEYPWVESLKRAISGHNTPIDRDVFLTYLNNIVWSSPLAQPPNTEPSALLEYLLQIGILYVRPDRRIHFPDLYLHGFGLTRRGGVKRNL